MPKPVTIGDWLKWAKSKIDPLDAELIATFCFAPEDRDRSWLVTHENLAPVDLSSPTLDPSITMVEERAKGEPLAYLLGSQNFYGRDFTVTRDVLIPRIESEAIIDLAKTLKLPAGAHIADIGTGSGCLAITLDLEFPETTVTGFDFSHRALSVAKTNSEALRSHATFAHSDLLSAVSPKKHGSFDLIVANLPYVNPDWDWLNHTSLSHEPSIALFPEQGNAENGLSAYHRLFVELSEYTKIAPVANLILEADPCQHDDLIDLAKSYGWQRHITNGYALAFQPIAK